MPLEYAIRNSKPFLLAEALRNVTAGGMSYNYAFWVDPLSFREAHAYSDWPSTERVDEICTEGRREGGARLDDMLFAPVQGLLHQSMLLWQQDMGPIESKFSEGAYCLTSEHFLFIKCYFSLSDAFFGGTPNTVFWWERYYYAYHDYYLDKLHRFVGNAEALMNSLFFMHPERVISVWQGDPDAPLALYDPKRAFGGDTQYMLGECGSDPLLYYQFFVASPTDQDANRRNWDSRWNWRFWRWEEWWRRREPCRLTRLLPVEWLLHRPFGEMWLVPASNLEF